MENEYITNMNSNAIIDENETIQKLKKAEEELVEIKKKIRRKKQIMFESKTSNRRFYYRSKKFKR